MKNKVIVLVDFSKESENVILYALEFAHIHQKIVEIVFFKEKLGDKLISNHYVNKNQFVDKLVQKSGLEDLVVNVVLYPREMPVKQMQERIKDLFSLIIGHQKKIFLEQVFDDVNIIDGLVCPVVLVSNYSEIEPLTEMLFVSNYKTAEVTLMKIWNNFSSLYNKLCIHVIFRMEKDEKLTNIQDVFDKIFIDGDPDLCFRLSMFEANEFDEKVDNYIRNNKIEMTISA